MVLKDVSCDLETVRRRVKLVEGTPLSIVNANAAIAHDAMKCGARGFSGVFTNFHTDLYKWLLEAGPRHPQLADELAIFLSLAANAEGLGYPKNAKIHHQRLGTFDSPFSRVRPEDVLEKHWALSVILDQISQGAQSWRQKIRNAE